MSAGVSPAGVLLPESILGAPWFAAFAVAVAFNTIVYLGLTFSKLVPWPAQVHPSRVRALLPASLWKEESMPRIRNEARKSPDNPFRALRANSVRLNVPRGLALTGALVVLVALVNSAVDAGQDGGFRLAAFIYGLFMIVLSQILDRGRANPATMTWAWVAAITVLVATMSWDAVRLDSSVSITYGIIAMLITPAISLSWPAALTAGVVQVSLVATAAYLVEAVSTPLWGVAAFAALIAGYVLLHLRLNNIDNLSLEQMRTTRLQTTDALTECLSRPGLITVAPPILSAAAKTDSEVFIAIVDVVDMQGNNATYGTEYGDRVLQSTARAIATCLPDAALARWDGDAFAALGLGEAPDPEVLAAQIDEALERGGVWLGKVPITVRAGVASGPPGTDAIGRLTILASSSLRPAN